MKQSGQLESSFLQPCHPSLLPLTDSFAPALATRSVGPLAYKYGTHCHRGMPVFLVAWLQFFFSGTPPPAWHGRENLSLARVAGVRGGKFPLVWNPVWKVTDPVGQSWLFAVAALPVVCRLDSCLCRSGRRGIFFCESLSLCGTVKRTLCTLLLPTVSVFSL